MHVCMHMHLAEDMAAALNSEFPADPTIVRPGTVYNLRQRNILCIRCRVKFY